MAYPEGGPYEGTQFTTKYVLIGVDNNGAADVVGSADSIEAAMNMAAFLYSQPPGSGLQTFGIIPMMVLSAPAS
jgi:hypothetical protein